MKQKRSPFTVLMLIIIGAVFVQGVLGFLRVFYHFSKVYPSPSFATTYPTLIKVGLITGMVELLVLIPFFVSLYYLKKSVFIFMHLAFGATLIATITRTLYTITYIRGGMGLEFLVIIPLFFKSVVLIVLWIAFFIHLKKSQKDKSMVFS